jgi:hypothetical protein
LWAFGKELLEVLLAGGSSEELREGNDIRESRAHVARPNGIAGPTRSTAKDVRKYGLCPIVDHDPLRDEVPEGRITTECSAAGARTELSGRAGLKTNMEARPRLATRGSAAPGRCNIWLGGTRDGACHAAWRALAVVTAGSCRWLAAADG